jgi:glycosyltransferase involved in cell wall biosynthesis
MTSRDEVRRQNGSRIGFILHLTVPQDTEQFNHGCAFHSMTDSVCRAFLGRPKGICYTEYQPYMRGWRAFSLQEISMSLNLGRIAFVGNYVPRQCGIATFTSDICEAVAREYPDADVFAIPMNDIDGGYAYPPRVRFEVDERDIAAYRRAADFLNINSVDLVCLQHEFGIFGGPAGSHILALLSELRMPVVTTLHTVLRDPTQHQRRVMAELSQASDRMVVMSEHSRQFLRDIYDVPDDKIDMIHHGIPDVPFIDPNYYKDRFGVEGKTTILTFGLLSPNKGIETMIQALPGVLEKHPDVVYIVLGATHPALKRSQGESYRLSLERLVQSLDIEENVIFHNRFVSLDELVEFIGCADLYVTPYLNEAQVVSGTLAYSVGAGKAVISTPYWYAEELLADGRGRLVPFKDSAALTQQVLELLDEEPQRHAMRKRAYELGRNMIWKHVAGQYMESFGKAYEQREQRPRRGAMMTLKKKRSDMPPLNLDHLRTLTDHTGILEHATFNVPQYSGGYSTQDNAMALALSVLLEEIGETNKREVQQLSLRYLAFLQLAFDEKEGAFRDHLTYDRTWHEVDKSEECHGRVLWALGTAVGRSSDEGVRNVAGRLFEELLPKAAAYTYPRAQAYSLLGIMEFMRQFYGHRAAQEIRLNLSLGLMKRYHDSVTPEWPWFDQELTYCNALLPHALMESGQWIGNGEMVDVGLRSLEWLMKVQWMGGDVLVPIGDDGYYPRGGARARFNQRPIEVYVTVTACIGAYRMTADERWLKEASRAFQWFLGQNDLRVELYNHQNGGCYDGLTPVGPNRNQGAQATIAFLLSLVEMTLAQNVIQTPEKRAAEHAARLILEAAEEAKTDAAAEAPIEAEGEARAEVS